MRHRKSNKKQAIPVEKKEERYRILKTETGLAPVPPLGVVAVKKDLLASCSLHLRLFLFYSVLSRPNRWVSLFLFSFCRIEEKSLGCWCCRVASSLEILQEISQQKKKNQKEGCIYLMVLPVLKRIHWGIGRFCFWALASFCLVRKLLWLCTNKKKSATIII